MPDIKQIGNLNAETTKWGEQSNRGRVYDTDYVAPALNCMQGGGVTTAHSRVPSARWSWRNDSNGGTQFYQQDRVYDIGDVAMCHPANIPGGSYRYLVAMRKRENGQELEMQTEDITNTLTSVQKDNLILEQTEGEKSMEPGILEEWLWEIDGEIYLIRIRKLTPKECWRLMDFTGEDYLKAEQVNSATQLYKQAGNSIVVACLEEIFKGMM